MNKRTFLKAALLISLLAPSTVIAQTSGRDDGLRFVPDVPGQFRALTERADPLGFNVGGSPNPSHCKHYQAITRVDGADGTPFFLVTRSGNTPDIPNLPDDLVCDDSPGETGNGHLIVFRMGSRPKHGERLGSNRLRKGVHVDNTAPPLEDKATIYYTFVGGIPNHPDPAMRPGLVLRDGEGTIPDRAYQHPGGMQLIGNILAVALETPRPYPTALCKLVPDHELCDYDPADDPTLIMFFDVSDPEAPVFKSQFALRHPEGDPFLKAGVVAITPLPGGRYLMAVTGGDGKAVHFFRSTTNNLASESLSWKFVNKTFPEVDDDPQQTLQFLREGNIKGDLYLAGVRGHGAYGPDHDKIDLYLVKGDTEDFEPGETVKQTIRYRGQPITTFPNTGGGRLANGAAASGFYISPSGELILYVTEHDNDGPSGSVKAGEWRHENMVRDGSPTLLPTAVVNGPYVVDEGGTVSFNGAAQPPITKAWIQLFHETVFSSFYPSVDFDNYARDDFDNFAALEFRLIPPATFFNHADKARSWKWYAPVGCSILATDLHNGTVDETRTLAGTGAVQSDADLKLVLNDGGTDDIDQEIDKVEFIPSCAQYYSAPFELRWDLDVDGSFETSGSPVTFNAAAFDGPSIVNVPAQAQHPSGGLAGQATAKVTVRNVAPQLTQFRVTNSAAGQVNVDVPFVLTNVPVNVGADFGDPGVLDRQEATLTWGDGLVEAQTSFTAFDEAFGDAVGSLSHSHRYTAAGTYTLGLTVEDDDGGVDNEQAVVRVVTPAQAVTEILAMLDAAIAGTPDANVRRDLEKARKALVGGNDLGSSGALNMIQVGNNEAAIAFLQEAVTWLQRAQAGGADVATQIALLEQVVAALSATGV
jgi:hypothetical protein